MTFLRGNLYWFAVPMLILFLFVPAFAQIQTGAITGRATDGSGALILELK